MQQTTLFDQQTEFEAARAGKTQNELLRDYLVAHADEWIAMPILAKIITPSGIGAAVHSRVDDCRAVYGMQIVNRVRRPNRRSMSWYKYVTGPATED